MLLDEEFDADEVLREPDDYFEEDTGSDEFEMPELDFANKNNSFSDIDIAPEEKEDLYS